MISCYGTNRSGGCSLTISRSIFCDLFVFAGYGMAAAIADRVLLSLGDEDDGGGGCQCHGIQQILFREEHQGFSGVRKM